MINLSRKTRRGRSRKGEEGGAVEIEADGVVEDPEVEVGQEEEDVEEVGDFKRARFELWSKATDSNEGE